MPTCDVRSGTFSKQLVTVNHTHTWWYKSPLSVVCVRRLKVEFKKQAPGAGHLLDDGLVGTVVLTEQDATGELLRVVLVQAVQQGHVQVTLPCKLTVHKGTQLGRGEGDRERDHGHQGEREGKREMAKDIMSFLIAFTKIIFLPLVKEVEKGSP